ncbi:MAG: hypothetical protein ABI193_09550 [Minicystis sp.]
MSEEPRLDLAALIKIEVDRAVTPYVGKVPSMMIPKLRELSERYWRENPVAMALLRRKLQNAKLRSGTEATKVEGDIDHDGAANDSADKEES